VPTELPFKRGAIELLILKTVSWRPMHGYAIAQWIQDTTDDALRVEEGSLYPALHRMEEAGWIRARTITTERNRTARAYEITAEGRRRLSVEEERWRATTDAVNYVLKHA
jgi:PadR family transcriptional regulator, regulatory protein PadR